MTILQGLKIIDRANLPHPEREFVQSSRDLEEFPKIKDYVGWTIRTIEIKNGPWKNLYVNWLPKNEMPVELQQEMEEKKGMIWSDFEPAIQTNAVSAKWEYIDSSGNLAEFNFIPEDVDSFVQAYKENLEKGHHMTMAEIAKMFKDELSKLGFDINCSSGIPDTWNAERAYRKKIIQQTNDTHKTSFNL